jgi:integrase
MATTFPYLRQSKTGWYEYRRRIPDSLRTSFGNKREFKKALRTTSFKEALSRWKIADSEYETTVARFNRLQAVDGKLLSDDVLKEAMVIAEELARPVLRAGASPEERLRFELAEDAWQAKMDNKNDIVADRYTDWEQLQSDYAKGAWGSTNYQTPYLPKRPDDPDVLALKHVEHGAALILKPTWRDATEHYLRTNSSDRGRDTTKQAVYEKKTRSTLEKFGQSLGKQGSSTPLENITRQHARAFKETFKVGTGNKYNNILSSVANSWNREFAEQGFNNPFAGLSNKRQEQKQSIKRRSFTPDEWLKYVDLLTNWGNREIGLIGLIMAYTGCRNSEAAGLTVQEVRLDETVPNLVFRTNSIRSMEKGGLERAVPVFEPLIGYLRSYHESSAGVGAKDGFFRKYGAYRHFSNISQQLNNIIRNNLNISDKEVVAYSFRHALHDRGRAARVSTDIQEYIVGHRSSGSSRIHMLYGTRTPPAALVEDMKAILAQDLWETEFD